MSEHAASGIHCRFPGGKRAPAHLDREKQGYECDAPKVRDPSAGSAAVRSGKWSARAHAHHPGCREPLGRRKAQPPFSNKPVVFAVIYSLPGSRKCLACPSGWFSAQDCSAGDLHKYQLWTDNGAVLDDGTCAVKGGCAPLTLITFGAACCC